MAIDIMNIQPTTISRSLNDKFILLYGLEKSGKTSWAANIPNNLLLATEVGYHAISGISAVDITKWSDFKATLKQLNKAEAKEKFDTITIDTVAILYDLCEKYICAQADVDKIADIPWGAGYKMVASEFSTSLRQITLMGYGLIMLAHADIKNIKVSDEETIETVSPKLAARPLDIVNQLVDIIGYIEMKFDEHGNSTRNLITRRTANIVAGSRFEHLPPRIPFGYNQLIDALMRAIDMSESQGATITAETTSNGPVITDRPYDEILTEAKSLWTTFVEREITDKALDKVQDIFGERKRLSDITPSQKELFELLMIELRTL